MNAHDTAMFEWGCVRICIGLYKLTSCAVSPKVFATTKIVMFPFDAGRSIILSIIKSKDTVGQIMA